MKHNEPLWLNWAKRIQGLAQAGLAYSKDKYDVDRFEQLRSISVEIMQEYTEAGEEKIRELFCNEYGYQTPKIDVRGAVIKENKILLVHEDIDGKWSLPGGWADIELSIRENIEKECWEEAGMKAHATRLVCLLDWARATDVPRPWSLYKIMMLCDMKQWCFEANLETSEARFFGRDELPELSEIRTNRKLIDLAFEAYENKDFVAVVD